MRPMPLPSRTLKLATIGAVAAAALACIFSIRAQVSAQGLWTEKSAAEKTASAAQLSLKTFSALAKEVSPAVVNISSTKKVERKRLTSRWKRKPPMEPDFPLQDPYELFRRFFGEDLPQHFGPRQALGTGFVINEEGLILTNNHNVEGWKEVVVKLLNDEKEYKAVIVGADPKTDVVLLKIDAGRKLKPVPLGDSDRLEVGEWVVAIGNPFGLSHTVTAGIVSFKGRKDIMPEGRQGYYDFIQTDASINPGNSGGPLINIYGEVVGINTAISASGQGIGFAIPINMAKAVLPQLKESGRVSRSWLGVKIGDLSPELAESFGLKEAKGALVVEVLKDGPAEAADLKEGDIIVSFDGKPIREKGDLPWLASTAGVGKDVELKYLREGKERSVKVKLAEMPDDEGLAMRSLPALEGEEEEELGIIVSLATEPDLRRSGIKDIKTGVIVTDVKPDSAADRAGVMPGDCILKVNDETVEDVEVFKQAVRKIKSGSVVRLLLRRGDMKLFVAFRK